MLCFKKKIQNNKGRKVVSWLRIHLLLWEMQETRIPSLGQEDPLEEQMAPYSTMLAWRIPWTEEPGRLQSLG